MKTAFLVDFSIRTRVLVDIPDGTDPETVADSYSPLSDAVIRAAINKISADPRPYLEDNPEGVAVDTECPYPCGRDEEREKEADEWFAGADIRTMEISRPRGESTSP